MNNYSLLIGLIRNEFVMSLESKTGWGRNEVISNFDVAVAKASLQFMMESVEVTK